MPATAVERRLFAAFVAATLVGVLAFDIAALWTPLNVALFAAGVTLLAAFCSLYIILMTFSYGED